MIENDETRPVTIVWCECGQSIEYAAATNLATSTTYKELAKYTKKHRKIETVTLFEFKTKPFMNCKCFNK